MSTRPIRFYHHGDVVEVDAPATRTVLQWLREDALRTGTKEGCAEGDCGACTVVVGELDEAGGLVLRPVNACIRFLPTLDGKALFTVEDLAAADGALHPLQRALVDHHGSQCGFCTPGIVMSLWASHLRHRAAGTLPTRPSLADDLAGNLCRCTGYRPILDAAEASFGAPPVQLDEAPVLRALRLLRDDPPLQRPGYEAPRSTAALAALRLARPEARLLAGGTDLALWVTKQLKPLDDLIYIGDVTELRRIESTASTLVIGAAVPLEDAWQALAREWPTLAEMGRRFAGPPVRHAGTLGGNVANGSPIGDGAPVLMALDATLVLQRGERLRRLKLDGFYTGYLHNRLEPGEFLHSLEVPRDRCDGTVLRAWKVSKRHDCDISALSVGLSLRLEGERIAAVRMAFGGMAATVCRATRAEAALLGRVWDEQALHDAQAALAQDFDPISDLRASRAYRQQVAANLLRRWWLQTRPHDPLPPSALDLRAYEEPA